MKIAINGAGVAGPTLAYWLARSGHEPTLIEHAPRFRAGGYVIDFWGVGYDVAERMGLIPQLRGAGYQVKEVRFVGDEGKKASGFDAEVFERMTKGRYTSLPRGALAEVIYEALGGRTETLFGDSIAALEEHADGVRVALESGAERDFDLVVGADGLHSRVRALAFGDQERFEKPLGYWVAAFELPGYRPRDESVYVLHAVPGRQAARFALRGDRTLILFVFAAERMTSPTPHDDAARKAILRDIFSDAGWECPAILDAMEGVEDIYFDRVSQIRMDAWTKGRVALVGDAAACASLLAGEGTGLAMTEAYVLAGELARAGGDHRAAFAAYEERLRPFVDGKLKAAAAFASSFAPRSAFGVWLRNALMRLMVFPPVADLMIGSSLRDDFTLPDYEF